MHGHNEIMQCHVTHCQVMKDTQCAKLQVSVCVEVYEKSSLYQCECDGHVLYKYTNITKCIMYK